MKRNRIKVGVFAIVLLLLAMLFSGCGSETEILHFEQSHLKESSSKDHYAYGTLTDEEKTVYDQIVHAIEDREESVLVSTKDTRVLEKAYMAMRYDYCDFFWTDSYEYELYSNNQKEPVKLYFKPVYNCTEAEQEQYQTQIDTEAERMLKDLPENASDYEKVYYVYRMLIQETSYSEEAQNNQNIVSTFVTHETVCQGYAYATQYLLEKLGISCTTVLGNVSDGPHAWNLAKLDGDYYYIDTTWGNSQYLSRQDEQKENVVSKYIDYNYFGASTADIMQSHTADERISLPECTATADNYYVHEGRYITEWNPETIGAIFAQAYQNGENMVQVKFASTDLYEQAMQYFVEEYGIAKFCPGLSSFRYMEDIDSCVLFIVF